MHQAFADLQGCQRVRVRISARLQKHFATFWQGFAGLQRFFLVWGQGIRDLGWLVVGMWQGIMICKLRV